MIYQKIPRQRRGVKKSLVGVLRQNQLFEIAFEITQKNLIVLRGKKSENVSVIFLQVTQKMEKNRVAGTAAGIMIMTVRQAHGGVDYMSEKLLTQILEKIIFCFKMSIKSSSAYVGGVDYILNGNLIVAFL